MLELAGKGIKIVIITLLHAFKNTDMEKSKIDSNWAPKDENHSDWH